MKQLKTLLSSITSTSILPKYLHGIPFVYNDLRSSLGVTSKFLTYYSSEGILEHAVSLVRFSAGEARNTRGKTSCSVSVTVSSTSWVQCLRASALLNSAPNWRLIPSSQGWGSIKPLQFWKLNCFFHLPLRTHVHDIFEILSPCTSYL
jgi:hypothetical protein